MSVLDSALWITAIGMGLVFAAIILLWGLMRLLVQVFRDREPRENTLVVPPVEDIPSDEASHFEQRKKAAAAAVAFCLAQEAAQADTMRLQEAAGPKGDQLGAWQTIQRASELSQKIIQRNKKVQR